MNQAAINEYAILRELLRSDTLTAVNYVIENMYNTNKDAGLKIVSEYFTRNKTKISLDALRAMATLFANEKGFERVYSAVCVLINKKLTYMNQPRPNIRI